MPTVGTTPFYNEIILSYTIAFYSLLQYNLQKYKMAQWKSTVDVFFVS